MEKSESTESSFNLSNLSPSPRSKRPRKRLGLGEGSGHGKTCGKGNKGQRARSGYKSKPGFEGGQMPLHRRLPKVGFTSRKKVAGTNIFTLLTLEKIEQISDEAPNGVISIEFLKGKGLIKASTPKVKILGKEGITKKVSIEVHAISEGARSAIEAAGGTVTIL